MTDLQTEILTYLDALHARLTEAVRTSAAIPHFQELIQDIQAEKDKIAAWRSATEE